MRVFVRETLVENIIANVIAFTLVADDREGVRQSLRSRKQGGHHFQTARGLTTSRSQSPGLAGLGGGGEYKSAPPKLATGSPNYPPMSTSGQLAPPGTLDGDTGGGDHTEANTDKTSSGRSELE